MIFFLLEKFQGHMISFQYDLTMARDQPLESALNPIAPSGPFKEKFTECAKLMSELVKMDNDIYAQVEREKGRPDELQRKNEFLQEELKKAVKRAELLEKLIAPFVQGLQGAQEDPNFSNLLRDVASGEPSNTASRTC